MECKEALLNLVSFFIFSLLLYKACVRECDFSNTQFEATRCSAGCYDVIEAMHWCFYYLMPYRRVGSNCEALAGLAINSYVQNYFKAIDEARRGNSAPTAAPTAASPLENAAVSNSSSTLLIAIVAGAAFVIIALCVALLALCFTRKKRRHTSAQSNAQEGGVGVGGERKRAVVRRASSNRLHKQSSQANLRRASRSATLTCREKAPTQRSRRGTASGAANAHGEAADYAQIRLRKHSMTKYKKAALSQDSSDYVAAPRRQLPHANDAKHYDRVSIQRQSHTSYDRVAKKTSTAPSSAYEDDSEKLHANHSASSFAASSPNSYQLPASALDGSATMSGNYIQANSGASFL